MISQATIRSYSLTTAAVECLEEVGLTDSEVDADFQAVVGDGSALLTSCLEGADEDRVQGWTEYVASLVAASQRIAAGQ
jgi:hypothetical protein